MTANTAIQYVNKPNNRKREIKWRRWLYNSWPVVCVLYEWLTLKKSCCGLLLVSLQHKDAFVFFFFFFPQLALEKNAICLWLYQTFFPLAARLAAFNTGSLKEPISVSECQPGETAEKLQEAKRTHVCQAEHPETPSMNMPGLILNQQQGNFGCVSQPESTNGAEAQCQCVIHLNTVKLKAVYCSQRPFILLNATPPLANLSVRASTCQDEEGKKLGLSE